MMSDEAPERKRIEMWRSRANALAAERDQLRAALIDIADTDPVDAVLDPTRPIRIALHETEASRGKEFDRVLDFLDEHGVHFTITDRQDGKEDSIARRGNHMQMLRRLFITGDDAS